MRRTYPNRKVQLVLAAKKLFKKNGIKSVSLGDIAAECKLAVGAIYYHFKTKDALLAAVIAHYREVLQTQFEELNRLSDGLTRLRKLITDGLTPIDDLISFGDSIGNLCFEISHENGQSREQLQYLMKDIIDWCSYQFTHAGKIDVADSMAINLIAILQGLSMLAFTFNDKDYYVKNVGAVIKWIESVT